MDGGGQGTQEHTPPLPPAPEGGRLPNFAQEGQAGPPQKGGQGPQTATQGQGDEGQKEASLHNVGLVIVVGGGGGDGEGT